MTFIRSALIALLLSAYLVPQAQAETRLSRDLEKMGSDLCRSLKLHCKNTGKPPRKARRASTKSAKKTVPKTDARTERVAVAPEPRLVPIPRPKPQRAAISPPAAAAVFVLPRPKIVVPQQKPVMPKPPQQQAVLVPPVPPPVTDASCMANLKRQGAEFEPVAAPASSGNCTVDMPVRLLSVGTPAGRISLPEGPVVGCRFALQFSLYLGDMGAAAAAMDKRLAKVATGPGFVCRGRNGDVSGKLSEHAYGNALDITTIGMASGETIQVADALNAGSPSFTLLREMRARACGYFSTVLGPGANAAHAEHFHFDMGRHGKSATYKICE